MVKFSARAALCLLAAALLLSAAGPAAADIARDFNTGVYLYKKGEYDLAAKTFEMILDKFPGDERTDEVLYWYGECRYYQDKFPDALGIYKKLAAEYPKSKFTLKGLFSAGYAAMKLNKYRDAAAFFKEVAADPGTDRERVVDCRIQIAQCFLKEGDDREAEKALREILATPKLPSAGRQEAEFELGRVLVRTGRSAEARSAFTRASEKSGPHQAEAFMALGDAAYAEGKYPESIEWYDKIIRKVRGVPQAFRARAVYNSAWSLLALGETDKALSRFGEVVEDKEASQDIRGDAAIRQAILYREKGADKLAGEKSEAAEKIAEESAQPNLRNEVLLFRAESAFLAKKFDVALAHLAQVTDKGYRVLRLTGQIFFESGRTADAALYFDRAAVAAPNRSAINLCLFDMAQSHFLSGAFDTAVLALGRIKDPEPDLNARLQPFLAEALQSAGKFVEAARQYEGLVAAASLDTFAAQRYRYFAALAYFQADRLNESSRILRSFVDALPDIRDPRSRDAIAGIAGDSVQAGALLLHADVLTRQGLHKDALVAYLRAVFAARTVGPDVLYLAYTHLIDFALEHAPGRVAENADDFVEALGDTRTYRFVIERLYDANHYTNLLKYSEDIASKFPKSSELYGRALYYRMMTFYQRRKFSAASGKQEELAKWLADHPVRDLAEGSDFWRARISQEQGDRAAAKGAFLSYLDLHPTGRYTAEARFNLGLLALDDRELQDAEREFLKLLAGKSQSDILAAPLLADAQYNLASVRILQDRFADALALLEILAAHKSFKNDPDYLYKIGYVYVAVGRFQEAEAHYRNIIGMGDVPGGTMDNAVYALFSLLYRSERYPELEADFNRYSGRIKDKTLQARAKYLMGMTLFDAERYNDAMVFFKAVKTPKDTELVLDAGMRLADCDYNLKRYKTALERYTEIAEDYPATHWGREALYASGLCKIKLGFPEGALSGFERFLQQNPDEPLAMDVAREAARLYLSLGDLESAEQKLDFLEKRKVEGSMLEEIMRMRIRIWHRRGDADKVLTLAKSHRGAYGPNVEVTLAAAESAIRLGRAQEALDAMEGFDSREVDTHDRAFMDFYRAEALHKLGRDGAVELYRRLADFGDTEIRLSSRYRYGMFFLGRREYAPAREMFVSVISDPAAPLMSFFQESILSALGAAKEANEPEQTRKIYAAFKDRISAESNRIASAEYNLWANLAIKDNAKSQAAIQELLALHLDPRRRAEILMVSAQLHEAAEDYAGADAIYGGVMDNPDAPEEIRRKAEARKVELGILRGETGRPILEAYLEAGHRGEWAGRAAESLLAAAVADKRYADIIRTVDLIQRKLDTVRPAARYASALAHLSLSDTAGALEDFRRVVAEGSSETFYIAWSAYRLAQDELIQRRMPEAGNFLKLAWRHRVNLDTPAALNTYGQLAEILVESTDFAGIQALAADAPPEGLGSEPHLLMGLAAWASNDNAAAVRHLKEAVTTTERVRPRYAEALVRTGDTLSAIAEYERLAEGQGPDAGRAQLTAATLLDSIGKSSEGLIAYYKVLAVHESDTQSELGAEALLGISRLYARLGDVQKSKDAASELIKKYPNSRPAKEAQALAGGP